jgi:hypothetical protein
VTIQSRRGRIVPPDLDDRTWQDLVDQMRALIPKYAPQWTDHNPSDVGIALIELFAWLAEGIIYRLNQTPEKNYIAFLNLLGITQAPATPALTYLTFTSGAGTVIVPAGTQAQTPAKDGERPIVFETDEDVNVLQTTLKAVLAIGPYPAGAASSQYDDISATLIGPPAVKFPVTVPPGQTLQLALGFDQRVADQIELGWRLHLPVPDPAQVSLRWAYSKDQVEPLAWPPLDGVADATGSLQRDGSMRLTPPGDWTAQGNPWATVTARSGGAAAPDQLFWIGLQITNPAGVSLAIGIDRLLFNAAQARAALTTRTPDNIGLSTGDPFQVFQLSNRPLFRRPGIGPPYADLVVQVGSGNPLVWQDWSLVDDLPPGPGLVYRANPVTGEISFGNFDQASQGQGGGDASQGHGSVPPAGSQIRAVYRYVGAGQAGNVAGGQVTVLGTTRAGTLPTGVTGVTNLGPGQDGTDDEPVEDTLRRAPEELKIRDRAVTADDYEFLAGEASNQVLIQRCLPPRLDGNGDPWTYGGIIRAPGNVNLIIVPDQGDSVARPEPTWDLIRQVRGYLEPRRDLTANLAVLGPRYLPVIVTVNVVVWQQAIDAGADQAKVQADTLKLINAFLHPTRGGPSGAGWQVGQPVFTSDLFQAIMPAPDLGYISALQVRPDAPAYSPQDRPFDQPDFAASVRVADYELVCAAASHQVKASDVEPI